MVLKSFIKRNLVSLVIVALLFSLAIYAHFENKAYAYTSVYNEYIFTASEKDEICRELDSIGVGYLKDEGESFLLIQNKDRSKALLYLASKGLPRNPKTRAEIDEENGVETTCRFYPPLIPIARSRKISDFFHEEENHRVTSLFHSAHGLIKGLGLCPGELGSEETMERKEESERKYLADKVDELLEIITSVDGVENAWIKVVPRPGYREYCGRGHCTVLIKLALKPGFTPDKVQVRSIGYLTSVYIEFFKITGVAVVYNNKNGEIIKKCFDYNVSVTYPGGDGF